MFETVLVLWDESGTAETILPYARQITAMFRANVIIVSISEYNVAKALHATGRPVILLRPPAKDTAIQRRGLLKRLLVPLDGSKAGEAAIPLAEDMARASGAELILYQVVELAQQPGKPFANVVAHTNSQEIENRRASAITYLKNVEKPLKDRGLNTSTATGSGSPVDQIPGYAKASAIDLIAMSTHGLSGIGQWVFGSVTEKILHNSDTSVMVVPAAKA